MASYIDVDGKKFVQLDDGAIVPVFVGLSLDGGTEVKLRADQIDLLRTPNLPTTYPLPQAQVDALRNLTLTGFPTNFAVNNFPAGFNCSNLPTEYPMSAAQATNLNTIATQISAFAKNAGATNANTLRVRLASDQESLPIAPARATGVVRGSITLSTTPVTFAFADSTRRAVSIYNDASSILYVALGSGASSTDFTTKLYQDEFYEVPETLAQLLITGVWAAGTGSAKVSQSY